MGRKKTSRLTSNSFQPEQTLSYSSAERRARASFNTDLKETPSATSNTAPYDTAPYGTAPAGPPGSSQKPDIAVASQLGKRKALTPPPSVGPGNMAEPPAKRSRRPDIATSDTNDRGNRADVRKEDRDRRDDRDGRDRWRERSRSRSPARGGRRGGRRGRSRSPGRDGGRDVREKGGARNRSPPRGPRGRGTSPSRKPSSKASAVQPQIPILEKMDLDSPDLDDVDAQAEYMQKVMGFTGFKTTKNTKVPGNDKLWGIRRETEIKARQYMNRPGGFNRPLSPGRS